MQMCVPAERFPGKGRWLSIYDIPAAKVQATSHTVYGFGIPIATVPIQDQPVALAGKKLLHGFNLPGPEMLRQPFVSLL